jgi:hypothetical protein
MITERRDGRVAASPPLRSAGFSPRVFDLPPRKPLPRKLRIRCRRASGCGRQRTDPRSRSFAQDNLASGAASARRSLSSTPHPDSMSSHIWDVRGSRRIREAGASHEAIPSRAWNRGKSREAGAHGWAVSRARGTAKPSGKGVVGGSHAHRFALGVPHIFAMFRNWPAVWRGPAPLAARVGLFQNDGEGFPLA